MFGKKIRQNFNSVATLMAASERLRSSNRIRGFPPRIQFGHFSAHFLADLFAVLFADDTTGLDSDSDLHTLLTRVGTELN